MPRRGVEAEVLRIGRGRDGFAVIGDIAMVTFWRTDKPPNVDDARPQRSRSWWGDVRRGFVPAKPAGSCQTGIGDTGAGDKRYFWNTR